MEKINSNDFDVPISKNYILKAKNKLGSGSFGDIFLGINIKTNEKIAIKLELKNIPIPKIKIESKIYSIIQGGIGIPKIYFTGKDGKYNIMIMELLGENLEKIFNKNNRKFPLKTICEISNQTITRIEYIHSKNIIHRDIKPENFLIGINNNKNLLYLIDYGLSKKYQNKNGFHIPYYDGKKIIGTIRFISVNNHLGIEQSRRDDLESLAYVIIYLLKGNLPWIGLKGKNKKEKYEKIMNMKINSKLNVICDGLPKEFAIFLQYCRDIGFDETPNYNFLRKLIENVCNKNKIVLDNQLNFEEIIYFNEDEIKGIDDNNKDENNESEDEINIDVNEEKKFINDKENNSED